MEEQSRNNLYPVFFRMERFQTLVVGGGEAGAEKMRFLMKSSPNAQIKVVAPEFDPEIWEIKAQLPHIELIERKFQDGDLKGVELLIVATDDHQENLRIRNLAKQHAILTNVADTPELCDFYLGSIVTKGDVKIAISTNGKSPTFSKRLRMLLEEVLPEETNQLVDNLKQIRDNLKGDFSHKVQELNKLTESLVRKDHDR